MSDSISRLYEAVLAARGSDPATSRTARLLQSGRSKVAKKLAEEAVEVVIDAMHGDRGAVVRESADLIYNLVVLWASSGIRPQEVWDEMARREELLGIAEKLPKIHKLRPPQGARSWRWKAAAPGSGAETYNPVGGRHSPDTPLQPFPAKWKPVRLITLQTIASGLLHAPPPL
jgi:phosphoribosyl-ATP pyrophosphohydrolase